MVREKEPLRNVLFLFASLPELVFNYGLGRLLLRASQTIQVGGGRDRRYDGTDEHVARIDPKESIQFQVGQ